MECKCYKGITNVYTTASFNINIMECKLTWKMLLAIVKDGFNINIMECKLLEGDV